MTRLLSRFGLIPRNSQATKTPIRAAIPADTGTEDGVAKLRLYDPIDDWGGEWGTSAKEFADALDALDSVHTIELHLNCPGGMAFEGIAILNLLRQHPAQVHAVVDGLAASAASFIAAGADRLTMAPNSQLMIHDAWAICIGPAADMREVADRLDHLSNNVASIYQAKGGGTLQEWRDRMLAETWINPEEAVTLGLADAVGDGSADPAPQNRFDLSVFKNAARGTDSDAEARIDGRIAAAIDGLAKALRPTEEQPTEVQPAAGMSALQTRRHRMNERRAALTG